MAEIFDFFAISKILEKHWQPPQADSAGLATGFFYHTSTVLNVSGWKPDFFLTFPGGKSYRLKTGSNFTL